MTGGRDYNERSAHSSLDNQAQAEVSAKWGIVIIEENSTYIII